MSCNKCFDACNSNNSVNVYPIPFNVIGNSFFNCKNKFLNIGNKSIKISDAQKIHLEEDLSNFFIGVDEYSVTSITLNPSKPDEPYTDVSIDNDTDFLIIYPDYSQITQTKNQNLWYILWRLSNTELDKIENNP